MSTGQAKEDNLVQLKTSENNTDSIRINNKINNLEKSLNDVNKEFKRSSKQLNITINELTNTDTDLELSVKTTLEKITSVEMEISQLYKDVDKTNVVINEHVQKVESDQTDLSTKVSETYKQLGSVEKSYAALKTKSSKITGEIKTITTTVEELSDEIRQKIINIENDSTQLTDKVNTVEQQSIESTKQLTQGQEELIERTNTIVADAKKTASALKKSIKENTTLMTDIEAKLISEIETLAKSTDEKTTDLSTGLTKANAEIKSHSAKMLQLQSVDEAIEKRAVKLEETAKSLTLETQNLLSATTILDQRSAALEDTVETLQIQVYRIEQENEIQQAQLDLLREKTSKTNQTLAALSRLVSINFVTTGVVISILVASIIALTIYQDDLWTTEATSTALRTEAVNNKISGLTDHVKSVDTQASDRIAQLENQVLTLNQQLKTVNDKNVSLDNRLVNIAPHRKIGNDNILHSQQWIQQQPGTNYAIKVLTASSEAEVFELAVRYNHNLNDVLSFKTVLENDKLNYVLYMGNYSNQESAEMALTKLPFRLNGATPELTTYENMI